VGERRRKHGDKSTAIQTAKLLGSALPCIACQPNAGSIQSVPAATDIVCSASGGTSAGRRRKRTE
jgi:hypothetical protein